MRRLTIAATTHITSVYLVEVPDDFDATDPDALRELVLGHEVLLLSQNTTDDVRVEGDEREALI